MSVGFFIFDALPILRSVRNCKNNLFVFKDYFHGLKKKSERNLHIGQN